MNAATLRALKQSIAHWKRLVKTTPGPLATETPYADECPLCKLFLPSLKDKGPKEKDCLGCPVFESGYLNQRKHCSNTPYREAESAWWHVVSSGPIMQMISGTYFHERWKEQAKTELLFLQSLLPVKRKKS